MKHWVLYIGLLLLTLGCVRELPEWEREGALPEEEGKVTITFTVPAVGGMLSTKALGEGDELGANGLETLHLAVFGSSGYLKEYVKAKNLGVVSGESAYPAADVRAGTVQYYMFSAALTLSEKRRFIHFIGNGPTTLPFGDTTTLFSLLSKENTPAYWQMIVAPKIMAVVNGNQYQTNSDGTYQPDDDTKKTFENIALIRNWSKIEIAVDHGTSDNPNDPQFELESFALVNVPKKGTLAPSYIAPDGKGGARRIFVNGYNQKQREYRDEEGNVVETETFGTVSALEKLGYEGVLPEDPSLFNGHIPEPDEFIDYNVSQAAYLYERPIPSATFQEPTFVIVYGTFTGDGQNKKYYYKIDLADQETSEYYPIFRDFVYQIKIHEIKAVGYATPDLAAKSPGGVNVSADVTASHFSDISDGVARIVVQPWMEKSYHSATEDRVSVKFISNIQGDPSTDPGLNQYNGTNASDPASNPVTYQILPLTKVVDHETVTYPDIFTVESVSGPSGGTGTEKGWRTFVIKTVDPGDDWDGERTQTLRVKGVYTQQVGSTVVEKYLYRDILITVLPPQTMYVACCAPGDRASLKGKPLGQWPELVIDPDEGAEVLSPLNLEIAIPATGLVESMFPLDLVIEPENKTLTPNSGETLPVVSGRSISGKNTFQYVKTLTWSDYQSLQADADCIWTESNDASYCHIPCVFLTTQRESASRIHVGNEFFKACSTEFFNNHTFSDLSFRSSIVLGQPVQVNFEVEQKASGDFPRVKLEAEGMTIDGLSVYAEEGTTKTYYFDPTQVQNTFTCTQDPSLSRYGKISLKASAEGYRGKEISSHQFRVIGFLDGISSSNIAHGYIIHDINNGKSAPFGFCHEAGYPVATLIKVLNVDTDTPLAELSYSYESSYVIKSTSITNFPNGVDSTYHEIKFSTKKGNPAPIPAFRLVANGYWEETVESRPRFTGTICNWNTQNNYIQKNNIKKTFDWTSDNMEANIKFEATSGGTCTETNSGLQLIPQTAGTASTFQMTVKSNNANPLYYVELTFDKDPDALSVTSVDAAKGAKVIRYLGSGTSNRQYLWSTPMLESTEPVSTPTTLTITTDHTVYVKKIIIKAVKDAVWGTSN